MQAGGAAAEGDIVIAGGDDTDSPKASIRDRASKAVVEATASAKKGAAKAAEVSRQTYEKVKEKTAEYGKEIGERTKQARFLSLFSFRFLAFFCWLPPVLLLYFCAGFP